MLGKAGLPRTFITLTVDANRPGTPAEHARELVAAFVTVRRRHCKRAGIKRFPFLAVFEKTKAGQPHLHILSRVEWIDHRWLSEQMDELLGSPIVDIRRVRSRHRAAAYVAKYCSKEPEPFKGSKRYWRSMDWQIVQMEKDTPVKAFWSPWDSRVASLRDLYETQARYYQDVTWTGRYLLMEGKRDPPETLPAGW